MEQELDLIEQARHAGQAYIDSFHGDLDAMCEDLNQRTAREGRVVAASSPKPPYPWQLLDSTVAVASDKKAS